MALVWLIACTNASNLLIARVTSRRRELAVRAALGASRDRVVRYLLAESFVLALGSVVVGIALAWVGIGLLRTVGANYLSAHAGNHAGRRGALAAGRRSRLRARLIFGLIPALHGSGGPVDESLRSLGTLVDRQPRRCDACGGCSSEASSPIATPLLVVAGLLLTSLNELQTRRPGVRHAAT